MGPKHRNTNTDRQSETEVRRRPGRPAFPRELVLAAADALFADTDAPKSVSMDDIAAAAGVGKGTLFRAFGSRDGLLDALFAARAAPLVAELEKPDSPLGPEVPPRQRILTLVDELLSFKFDNPHLTAARELSVTGLLQTPHYVWMHDTLRTLIEQAESVAAAESATAEPAASDGSVNPSGSGASAGYLAHVLLGGLRVDLIDELLTSGHSREDIRRDVALLVRRVLET